MRITKLAGLAALVILAGTALLPVPEWAQWDDLSVGATWPCSITGLSAAGMSPDAPNAGSVAPAEQLDVETVLCTRPARRRMQTVFLVSLVVVGSVAVIERYRRSIGHAETGDSASKPAPAPTVSMTKAAALIASLVLLGTALLPAPQWVGEFELLSPGLACPVTVLSAAGVLPSSYDASPDVLPDELDEVRQKCIGPARSRLVTVLLVSAVTVQSVAVFEYSRNQRRRRWEIELQDQKHLFASVED